jgi:adenylate cyclase
MARLRVRRPDGTESIFELTKAETRIGRVEPLVDLALPDQMASRIHAVVRRLQSGFTVVDLRSANRTYVNGEPVTERRLKEGDVIRIGQTTLVFEASQRSVASVQQTDQPIPESGTVMLANPTALTIEPVGPIVTPEEIRKLRKKAETLGRLFNLSKTLGSVFNLDEIFSHVGDLMLKETPADYVVIFLSEGPGELAASMSKTRDSLGKGDEPVTVSRTILRRAVDERVSVLFHDDTNADRSSTMLLQNIHSAICAPLLGTDGVLGALYVDRRAPLNTLTEDDLELVNAVAASVSIAVEKAHSHRELSRAEVARATYERFLPAHVVEQILEAPDNLKLGGVTQIITVLFADISGFTPLSERAHPEQVVEMLNRLFSVMTEIVFEHGGTLDKYIGDALMALFGAPYVGTHDARNALLAALAMQRALPALNEEFRALGFPRVNLSIGLNTGPATVGYIGSERRMDYTAIGDTVNLAARLQSSAKPGQVLVSEATSRAVDDPSLLRQLGKIKVKGREGEVQVYEAQ